jgi:hypothetical protein
MGEETMDAALTDALYDRSIRDAALDSSTDGSYDDVLQEREADPGCVRPVLHYSFDAESYRGDTIVDEMGNHDGFVHGQLALVPGIFREAMHFDGTNNYVSIDAMIEVTEGMTISAWVRLSGFVGTSNVSFVDKWDYLENQRCFRLGTNPGDRATAFFSTDGRLWEHLSSNDTEPPPLNVWTHYAATFDSESSTLYRDGEPIPATHDVVACAARHVIPTPSALQGVGTIAAIDDLTVGSTDQGVVAVLSEQLIHPRSAEQAIVAGSTIGHRCCGPRAIDCRSRWCCRRRRRFRRRRRRRSGRTGNRWPRRCLWSRR